jgi:hypothetical protein
MANELFKNFPQLQYTLNTGKIVTIKDFFRKVQVEKSAQDSLIDYEKYEILDGERPDVVAAKLYGNGDLHWTIFLVNEFTNYYDWHMDFQTFQTYITAKFPGQSLTALNTTDIVSSSSKFLIGEECTSNLGNTGSVTQVEPTYSRISIEGADTFAAGETVTGSRSGKSFVIQSVTEHRDSAHHYKDADGNRRNNGGTGWTAVSNFIEESEDNERKRNIKIIRPNKIKTVVAEFERLMANE